MQNKYRPEGSYIRTPENREYITSPDGLDRAAVQGRILEATALLCDSSMRLHVDLYGVRGIIEPSEAAYDPSGASIKDIAIITRVGKPVCFKVIGRDVDRDGEYYRLYRSFDVNTRTLGEICVNRFKVGSTVNDFGCRKSAAFASPYAAIEP